MSATTDLGKVGITVNGTWSDSVAYEKNSIVNDGADSYISIQDVPTGTALSNTAYWSLLCNGFSSAEVVSAVNAWLVAHPEATTTVQDGAVTYAKLGDDVTDIFAEYDKNNARDIIGLSASNTVTMTNRNYWISSGVTCEANKKYLVSIKLNTNHAGTYGVMAIKPDGSGYVEQNIITKSVTANTDTIFNVIYTPTANCRFGIQYAYTGVDITIETYVYDITDYDENLLTIGDELIDKGFAVIAQHAHKATKSDKATLAEKLYADYESQITGQAWSFSTGYTVWDTSHSYLVVLGGDLTGIDASPIGFLNSGGTWAGSYALTSRFSDNGGYGVVTPPASAKSDTPIRIKWSNNTTSVNVTCKIIELPLNATVDYHAALLIRDNPANIDGLDIFKSMGKKLSNTWVNKSVLFIGDSLTEANRYQRVVVEKLGINYVNHCKGGASIIGLIDGVDTLAALSIDDVTGKDLIILYACYNDRQYLVGEVGDLYPTQTTIAGRMQYAINTIYTLLASANNLTCKLLIVTVDCAGKYQYIDADGYTEYPTGTGQTMESIANIQKAVAEANSIACLDLWHNSGINRNTWTVFGANPNAYVENPSPTSAPYPHNGDQLHKSNAGYVRIGECIVGSILDNYGS